MWHKPVLCSWIRQHWSQKDLDFPRCHPKQRHKPKEPNAEHQCSLTDSFTQQNPPAGTITLGVSAHTAKAHLYACEHLCVLWMFASWYHMSACVCVRVWKLISLVWALAATPRYRWGYCGFSTWSYRPSRSVVCLCGWGDNETTRILFASFPSGHFPSHLAHFDPGMFKAAPSRQEAGEWAYVGWP